MANNNGINVFCICDLNKLSIDLVLLANYSRIRLRSATLSNIKQPLQFLQK